MKVLHITTNYPTPEYPIFGIFVKEQVDSLQKLGLNWMYFIAMVRAKDSKVYNLYPKIIQKDS